ncbi:MAG: sulfotransferase [Bacteroidota bacterium]
MMGLFNKRKSRSAPKIFCIGKNKTGTTSVEQAFRQHGFRVGDQAKAELLVASWANRDFETIATYCEDAEAFQDVPFSLPFTYVYLDQVFPNAKFILTIRNSADEWYDSLIRFYSQLFSETGDIPTKADLQRATYRYEGYAWEVNRLLNDTPENDPYNTTILKASYERYNASVTQYFRHKNNCLVLNLSDENAYTQFCNFLDLQPLMDAFPWENKTQTV